MILLRQSHEIITSKESIRFATKEIELAARVSRLSYGRISENSDSALIKFLLDHKHDSVIEFGPSITVRFITSRAVANQIVRHRLASYSQESTRYCLYRDHLSFIIPGWVKSIIPGLYDRSSILDIIKTLDASSVLWIKTMCEIEQAYMEMINAGRKPEEARDLLPLCLKTELFVSANIREWRHILKLRTNKRAHYDMQDLMLPLLSDLIELCPVLFSDIKSGSD